jgi:hypothetical protein
MVSTLSISSGLPVVLCTISYLKLMGRMKFGLAVFIWLLVIGMAK